MDHLDLSTIIPMESYTPPNIPPLAALAGQPPPTPKGAALWKKSALTLATAGVLGVTALASCQAAVPLLPPYEADITAAYQPIEFDDHLHYGGAGMAFYVVYPTEAQVQGIRMLKYQMASASKNDSHQGWLQATSPGSCQVDTAGGALGLRLVRQWDNQTHYIVYLPEADARYIILRQLIEAGLDLRTNLTGFSFQWDSNYFSHGLFDTQRKIAFYYTHWQGNEFASHHLRMRARDVFDAFEWFDDVDGIILGVLYPPALNITQELGIDVTGTWDGEMTPDGQWVFHQPPPPAQVAEINARARPLLEAQLAQNVDVYIQHLRDQGVI